MMNLLALPTVLIGGEVTTPCARAVVARPATANKDWYNMMRIRELSVEKGSDALICQGVKE